MLFTKDDARKLNFLPPPPLSPLALSLLLKTCKLSIIEEKLLGKNVVLLQKLVKLQTLYCYEFFEIQTELKTNVENIKKFFINVN